MAATGSYIVDEALENHEFCDKTVPDAASSSTEPPAPSETQQQSREKAKPNSKTKKKAQPVRRPSAKYKVTDLMSNIVSYMVTVLVALKTHDVYSNQEYPNTEPLQQATSILCDNSDHPAFVNFCKKIGDDIWPIITSADKRVLNGQTYDSIITKFHQLRCSTNPRTMWEGLLRTLNIKCEDVVSNVMYQYILRSLFRLITDQRNQKDLPQEEDTTQSTPLSKSDHQVIHYIAGYIPFSLIKTLSRSTKYASKFLPILKSWRLNNSKKDDDFVTYVKDWMKKQDRGYLFKPNWELHVFFRTLEYVGRKYLHASAIKTYRDSNLHEILTKVFETNKTVQERWHALVKDHGLGSRASEQLFKLIISKWIKTRCTAYVKVYIDIRKRSDKNLSRKGEHSLRKQVDK